MPRQWTEREEQVYSELVEQLRFWGYQVPAGEKLVDPALLLMLKTFAYHSVELNDRLSNVGDEIIDTLISTFFMTAVKRPVPASTMISCECADERAVIDTDVEFVCHLPGTEQKDYSFYPLYPQEIYAVDCDIVIFSSSDRFQVLRSSSPETSSWVSSAPELAHQVGSSKTLGGSIYIGLVTDLAIDKLEGIQLYTGPDLAINHILNWANWAVMNSSDVFETFKPGKYEDKLEIFKHLDIREFEIDGSFQSRLYSSDFLTSGKLLWHYKHYLAASKCFVYLPSARFVGAEKFPYPVELELRYGSQIDFGGLTTPRLWLKINLEPDEKFSDLRKLGYFQTNTFPIINRHKSYRNKFSVGQPVLEVDLFELDDEEESHHPDKLFSIDRVWDSADKQYANFLDLDSYDNPRKYLITEDSGKVKVKFDFSPVGEDPPDFVVVEYSLTEGSAGNGIGADVEFELAESHPQIKSVQSLITSRGGSDAKSAEEIKRLVGFFLRNHGVAISEGEIEYLAKNFDPRIESAKAKKGISRTPGGLLPSVVVDVDLKPDLTLTDEEREFLFQRLSEYLDCFTPINLHLSARLVESG